jgi:hypothetical protein
MREEVVALIKNEGIADDRMASIFRAHNYDAVVAFLFQMFSCTLEVVSMVNYGACPGKYRFLNIVLQQSKIQEGLGDISYTLSRLQTVEFMPAAVDYSDRQPRLGFLSQIEVSRQS